MPHSVSLIATVAAAFGLALLLGFVAARLRVPALVGYLLAGVIIGPATPGFVADVDIASQLVFGEQELARAMTQYVVERLPAST